MYRDICVKSKFIRYIALLQSFLIVSLCIDLTFWICSKLRNMTKGYKHVEAAPIFDKIIFSKVDVVLHFNFSLCYFLNVFKQRCGLTKICSPHFWLLTFR